MKRSSLYLNGTGQLYVYGCTGIIEYNDDNVKLKLCDGVLDVYGKKLTLERFCESELGIKGKVEKINIAEAT